MNMTPDEKAICSQVEAAREALSIPEGLTLVEPADDLFRRVSAGVSHVPELRALQYRLDFLGSVRDVAEHAGRFLTGGDLEALTAAWSSYLGRQGACVSSMIAGRSNFDVRKHRKSGDSSDRALQELQALIVKIKRRTRKEAEQARVDVAGGPLAILRSEIDELQKLLETMKEANRIIRSKPKNKETEAKLDKMEAAGLTRIQAVNLFDPDFAGRIGFPPFHSTNGRARLKTMIARLEELERRSICVDREPIEIRVSTVSSLKSFPDEALVVLDFEDNRLRIVFDFKPDAEVRQRLKLGGWRWARSEGAWQRQLTGNAGYEAQRLLGVEGLGERIHKEIRPGSDEDDA